MREYHHDVRPGLLALEVLLKARRAGITSNSFTRAVDFRGRSRFTERRTTVPSERRGRAGGAALDATRQQRYDALRATLGQPPSAAGAAGGRMLPGAQAGTPVPDAMRPTVYSGPERGTALRLVRDV
jgi:hypothetical protein